ncbi:hypothetical protein GCM10027053_49490 [Intrasporangium mesophilum]
MDELTPRTEPLVLDIRLSGRRAPIAALVAALCLMSFLGGSAAQVPGTDVMLVSGAPAVVAGAVAAVGRAGDGLTDSALAGLGGGSTAASAFADAPGGGFMFPAIQLTPLAARAIAVQVLAPYALADPVTGRPVFVHPVPGGETSSFGPRVHPVLGRPMFHTGIDLAATCGTPIRAAAAGKVIYAEVSASWGLRTIIEHTPTLRTAYGHQSRFFVKEGDVVKQGQVIGLVGTTGWSTGCHLHFDVILNSRYVDPAPYLGFPPSDAKSVPYAVVPHVVFDQGGRVVHTVEDGDVPLPDATIVAPGAATPTSRPPAGSSGVPRTDPSVPTARPSVPTRPTGPTSRPPATNPWTTIPPTSVPPTTPAPPVTSVPPTTPDPTMPDPTTPEPTTSSEPPSPGPPSPTEPAPTTSVSPAPADPSASQP